ncbi:MAG: complement resistance protein TraT [Proteobacteria bacterium]|nr:complement resistance protein TraT [Pseudomonadota bacterium]
MVKDPESGLQFGSVVERNLVTDASFFQNKNLKVRIRNTSGDRAFDLYGFKTRIEAAYKQAGYQPTSKDNFGLLVDVNVMYSGQIQTNLSKQFGFLGAAAGGLAGATRSDGVAIAAGTIAGATLGSIIGSFITDDTYIIVAKVTFGIVKGGAQRDGKRITFSRSLTGNAEDQEEREERRLRRGFKSTHATRLSVFAGGRNVSQAEIAGQVRSRFVRIIRDII